MEREAAQVNRSGRNVSVARHHSKARADGSIRALVPSFPSHEYSIKVRLTCNIEAR